MKGPWNKYLKNSRYLLPITTSIHKFSHKLQSHNKFTPKSISSKYIQFKYVLKHALYSTNDIEIARDYLLMKIQGDVIWKGQMRESKLGDLIMRFDYPMSNVQTPKGIATKHSSSLPSIL